MIQLSTTVFGIASEFRGEHAPFQAMRLEPHPDGGVVAMATRRGHVACIARDPGGQADEARTLLPSEDLLKAARPLKSAERFVIFDGPIATVTTRYGTGDKSAEFPAVDSGKEFPDLKSVLAGCVDHWGSRPKLTNTAGRYDAELLLKTVKAAAASSASLVLSAYDGGPLRLQSEAFEMVVLLMPQTAEPIPAVPDWLARFGHS